jgi:alpha-methylacyl-CoA racemase
LQQLTGMQALDGIKVLDLTRLLPGAVATLYLRRAGADVIKVEQPGQGDYARATPDLFAATNAGKKSVTIDLKQDNGREAFLKLLESADVLVESFRPGVMDRLGLGYDQTAARNQRLIYASLRGFSPNGGMADMAGHDINYLAMAGIFPLLAGQPSVQIADISGGSQQLIQQILLALLERHRTGRGSRVAVNMVDGLEPLLILPRSHRNHPLGGNCPCYRLYRASDGRQVAVGALEPKFWERLCRALGRQDLIPAQFVPDAVRQLEQIFLRRTAQEWFELLKPHDCCITPVLTLEEASTPAGDREPPPSLGQHNHLLQ